MLVLEVDDQRAASTPLELTVRTDRPAARIVGKHVTRCAVGGDRDGVFATQVFEEIAYHFAAAVMARLGDPEASIQPPADATLARRVSRRRNREAAGDDFQRGVVGRKGGRAGASARTVDGNRRSFL